MLELCGYVFGYLVLECYLWYLILEFYVIWYFNFMLFGTRVLCFIIWCTWIMLLCYVIWYLNCVIMLCYLVPEFYFILFSTWVLCIVNVSRQKDISYNSNVLVRPLFWEEECETSAGQQLGNDGTWIYIRVTSR